MSTFINTNMGESKKGLPISLLVAVLFVGVQFVVFVPSAIFSGDSEASIYSTPTSFNTVSLITGLLVFAYLVLDFWRWRQTGASRSYYIAFGGTALLLAAILFFLVRASGFVSTG